jgi:choline dehydrogenase-like flavoprotein
MTVANGTRSSSAFTYLAPQYAARANLHVVVNHRATKLLQTEADATLPDFRTVIFGLKDSSRLWFQITAPGLVLTTTIATSFNVTATKEVVLSAGSYGTPQLLLLSGIGGATELEDLGIEPTVDLPSVGKNLTDHPLVNMIWNVTETTVIDVYAALSLPSSSLF